MNAGQSRLDQSRDKKALSHTKAACTAFPQEGSLAGHLSKDQGTLGETRINMVKRIRISTGHERRAEPNQMKGGFRCWA